MASDHEILGVSPCASREELRAAYRALARRWHPDRFMEGPEREWASVRMAEINRAYRACLKTCRRARVQAEDDDERLEAARRLIDDGQYGNARAILMQISTRRAEWNYLFGLMLLHRQEYEKALVYLSVAAHQQPGPALKGDAAQPGQRQRVPHAAIAQLVAEFAVKRV